MRVQAPVFTPDFSSVRNLVGNSLFVEEFFIYHFLGEVLCLSYLVPVEKRKRPNDNEEAKDGCTKAAPYSVQEGWITSVVDSGVPIWIKSMVCINRTASLLQTISVKIKFLLQTLIK